MKPLLRWSLLLPAVVLGFVTPWFVSHFGISFALEECPREFQNAWSIGMHKSVFDLITENEQFCTAPWFPAVNRVLFASSTVLSITAAGFLGFRVAPSHKRLVAVLSTLVAIGMEIPVHENPPFRDM